MHLGAQWQKTLGTDSTLPKLKNVNSTTDQSFLIAASPNAHTHTSLMLVRLPLSTLAPV